MMLHSTVLRPTQPLIIMIGLAACTSNEESSTGGGSLSESAIDASTTSSSTSGGKPVSDCVTGLTPGMEVTIRYEEGARPEPAGGVLVDGEYNLTAWTAYGQTSGPPRVTSRILRIDGNRLESVSRETGGTNEFTASYRVLENAIVLEQTCPAPPEPSEEGLMFTATAGKLSIFTDEGTVLTYERR